MRTLKILLYASLALVALFVAGAIWIGLKEHFVIGPVDESVQKNFAPLIGALENYSHANGRYPQKLDALIPSFVGQLPSCPKHSNPVLSDQTRYHVTDDGKRFWLTCDLGINVYMVSMTYRSEIKKWNRWD